jgi:hypothetical protein
MTLPEHDPLGELPWPGEPAAPRPEVTRAIHDECTKDLGCKRSLSAGRRVLLSVALSAFVVGLLVYLTYGRARPEGALRAALLGAAGWGIVQAAVLFVGLARPPGKRVSRRARLLIAVTVPIAFLAYLAFEGTRWLPLGAFVHTHAAGHAMACGLHALLFGAIVSGGTLLIWRRTDPLSPGLSGALAGLVGGLAGAVAIGVACPSGETWHLWVGHGLTVVALVFFGWAAGRRLLAP